MCMRVPTYERTRTFEKENVSIWQSVSIPSIVHIRTCIHKKKNNRHSQTKQHQTASMDANKTPNNRLLRMCIIRIPIGLHINRTS